MNKHFDYYLLDTDKEFQNLIPPLSKFEFETLEDSIVRDGCLNDIIVWNNTIIDGHNRYKICKRHNIPFAIIEIDFNSKEEAKIWICRNQLGRKNISDDIRKYLIGKRFEFEKIVGAKNYQGNNPYRKTDELTNIEPTVLLNPQTNEKEYITELSAGKTSRRIADEYHITHLTVNKYATYARAVDKIESKVPGLREIIVSGKYKIPVPKIVRISELSAKNIKSLFEEIARLSEEDSSKDIKRRIDNETKDEKRGRPAGKADIPKIKSMPKYNPEAELLSLCFTVPSWNQTIISACEKTQFDNVSAETKTRTQTVMNEILNSINNILKLTKEGAKNE